MATELERPRTASASTGHAHTWQATLPPAPVADVRRLLRPSLILFGGKGGVGKTTCAAAAAVRLATGPAPRRVLLVSTDPAHSVGDVFRLEIGDASRAVPGTRGRLAAREIDAAARFADIRRRYTSAMDALFDRLTGGGPLDATHDRRVLARLLDLAPPGLDELVAVAEVADLTSSSRDVDVVVVDLAPTGHALRLLETPAVVHDWVKALMALLLKYQPVVGLGGVAEVLLALSKGLGRLRGLLRDPAACTFVVVTRAAALPRLETARLLASLARLHVPVGAVVANAAGRGRCARCRLEADAETRELRALQRLAGVRRLPLSLTPEMAPPPSGAAALGRWAGTWRVYDRP